MPELADSNLIWAAQDDVFAFAIQGTDDPTLQRIVKNFRVFDEEELERRALEAKIGFVMETMSGSKLIIYKEIQIRDGEKSRSCYFGTVPRSDL